MVQHYQQIFIMVVVILPKYMEQVIELQVQQQTLIFIQELLEQYSVEETMPEQQLQMLTQTMEQ